MVGFSTNFPTWAASSDPCAGNWAGVMCVAGSSSYSVTDLNMAVWTQTFLSGATIPTCLGQLTSLTNLNCTRGCLGCPLGLWGCSFSLLTAPVVFPDPGVSSSLLTSQSTHITMTAS